MTPARESYELSDLAFSDGLGNNESKKIYPTKIIMYYSDGSSHEMKVRNVTYGNENWNQFDIEGWYDNANKEYKTGVVRLDIVIPGYAETITRDMIIKSPNGEIQNPNPVSDGNTVLLVEDAKIVTETTTSTTSATTTTTSPKSGNSGNSGSNNSNQTQNTVTNNGNGGPKTGDSAPIGLIFVGSLMAVTAFAARKRRKEDDQ